MPPWTAFLSRRTAWLLLALAAAVSAAVLLAPVPDPAPPDSSTGLSAKYQSVEAERLGAGLPSSAIEPALLIFVRADGAALTKADERAVERSTAAVAQLAVGGKVAPAQISSGGEVGLAAVPLAADVPEEEVAEVVSQLRDQAKAALPADLMLQVTGPPAFTTDLIGVFDGADTNLLLVTLGVVALLLLLTYRSPFLWIVPLAVVAVAEQVTVRLVEQALPRLDLAFDGATTGITSVLVFGAATDYALLLIARYREQLRLTADRFAAMRTALRRTSEAILASGGTVVLAVLTLTLSDQEGNRGLGLAAAIGIVVAMIAGLLILPAALVVAGRGLFWPFVPRVGSMGKEGRVWGWLGDRVADRPVAVAVAATAVLLAMAAGGLGLRAGLSQTEQFRAEPEAVLGARTLATALPAGSGEPLTVFTTPAAAADVARASRDVDAVATARQAERTGDITVVEVVLEAESGSEAAAAAIGELRDVLSEVPAADAAVGGQAAAAADLEQAQQRDQRIVIPLVLILVLAVLIVLLRSLLGPLLLVATVVLGYTASVGVSWLLFTQLLDFPALEGGVPVLSFLFLVALGVDYNIFLITRAREEASQTSTKAGVLTALRVTGGVITSAGILLAAVFAVLGVLPLVALAQLGVIVGIGVLLDALLVRTVLVPALALSLGARFWWPARVDPQTAPRRLPAEVTTNKPPAIPPRHPPLTDHTPSPTDREAELPSD